MDNLIKSLFGFKDCRIIESKNAMDNSVPYTELRFSYDVEAANTCPVCGEKMYRHGSRDIKATDTPIFGKPARITVTVPRMRCRNPECKYIWMPELEYINEKHKLTNRAYSDIVQRSLSNTFASVGEDYMMSGVTIKNVFVDFWREQEQKLRFKTPAFLGIDEVKIKKIGEVTVITDLEHRTLFDMLKGRNQKTLTEYFMNLQDRDKILWVCTDMYRPFEGSIAEAMPNARWVIDHFHVIAKANEALDTVRRTVQSTMPKADRIATKKGMAYTLKTRLDKLSDEDAAKIRAARNTPGLESLAIAYDLKEEFFRIYDDNPSSKANAQEAFETWSASIPEDPVYDKFRELVGTVRRFYEQIFNRWDCPLMISNGYTECTNRIIRENNMRGRGYSFEILRARTLYRKTNLINIMNNGLALGPSIPKDGPVFLFEGTDAEADDDDDFEPFPEEDTDY